MKKTLTKEEKELLIKDLLLRTQTDVLVKVPGEEEPKELRKRVRWMITFGRAKSVEDCLTGLTPYLRPFSDMTEEESKEFDGISSMPIGAGFDTVEKRYDFYNYIIADFGCCKEIYIEDLAKILDWFILHHFDIYGLVEKELAIKAEKGMYEKQ